MSKLAGRSVLFAALAVPIAILAGPLTASAESADVAPVTDQVTVREDATTPRGDGGDDVDVTIDSNVNGIYHNNNETDLNVDVHDHGYDGHNNFADYQAIKPAPAAETVSTTHDQFGTGVDAPEGAGVTAPRDGGPSLAIEWYDVFGAAAGSVVDGAVGGSAEGGSVEVTGRGGDPDDQQHGDHQGDRPQGDRPQGDRPQGDRPQGDQQADQQADQQQADQADQQEADQVDQQADQQGDRPEGDRPQGDRPQGGQPQGGQPQVGLNAVWYDEFVAYAGSGGAWTYDAQGGMIGFG